MGSRVGNRSRRSVETERLWRLLVRLSSEDRAAFNAVIRLILRRNPRIYKMLYKQ